MWLQQSLDILDDGVGPVQIFIFLDKHIWGITTIPLNIEPAVKSILTI